MASLKRIGGTTAAAVLVFALAACGGGSSTASSTTAPTPTGPSKQDFLTQANTVCTKHRAIIDAAASKVLAGGQLPSPEAFGKLAMETIVPELTAQFRELRAVTPPADLTAAYTGYLSQADQTVTSITTNPALITDPTNFAALNKQGDDLGLNAACRVGPG